MLRTNGDKNLHSGYPIRQKKWIMIFLECHNQLKYTRVQILSKTLLLNHSEKKISVIKLRYLTDVHKTVRFLSHRIQ